MNIATMYGLPSVRAWTNSKVTPLECAHPPLLYGLELELENCPNYPDMVIPGMDSKEDGSLRSNGREFVLKPMTFSHVAYILNRFWKKNEIRPYHFSERCSIHVHVNCQDLSLEQIAGIALIYQVFEPLLFAYIGHDRDKSIFCVPWNQTTLTASVLLDPSTSFRRWQKYTALNLLRLFDLGTLEFRHMHGEHNVSRILDWCNIIGAMVAHGAEHSFDKIKQSLLSLNTTSAYRMSLETIFRQWAPLLMVPGYELLLEDGVLAAKYSVLEKQKKESKHAEVNAHFRIQEVLQQFDIQFAQRQGDLVELERRAFIDDVVNDERNF